MSHRTPIGALGAMEMEMITYGQVIQARIERSRRESAALIEQDRVAALLAQNPSIGVLMRKGEPIYYVNLPAYREARDPAALI